MCTNKNIWLCAVGYALPSGIVSAWQAVMVISFLIHLVFTFLVPSSRTNAQSSFVIKVSQMISNIFGVLFLFYVSLCFAFVVLYQNHLTYHYDNECTSRRSQSQANLKYPFYFGHKVINFTPLGVSEKEVGFIGFVSTVAYCAVAPFVAFTLDKLKKHFKSTLVFLCVTSTLAFGWLGLICIQVRNLISVLDLNLSTETNFHHLIF